MIIELKMHRKIYQKFLYYLSSFGVIVSVLVGFYDVIFGTIWEFMHLTFEVIEIALDHLVEIIFKTNLQQTQLIVFYILLSLGCVLLFLMWKALPYMCIGLCQNLKADWQELKMAVVEDWQAMSLMKRLLWVSGFLLVNYMASFLLF